MFNQSFTKDPVNSPGTVTPSTRGQSALANTRQYKWFNNKKLVIFLSVFASAVLLLIGFFAYNTFFKKTMTPSQAALDRYTSQTDKQAQLVISNLTGFNWSNLPRLNGSEKHMLTALLILSNEQSAVFQPEVATVTLTKAEIENLKLEKMDLNVTKDNLTKLINTLIAIETDYQKKGLVPAGTHLQRLNILKNYFGKHLPQQKHKIPEEAKETTGVIKVADNQLDFAKALLSRYNNWLSSVNLNL